MPIGVAIQRYCLERGLVPLGNDEYECPYNRETHGCEFLKRGLCVGNMYVGNHGADKKALKIIQDSLVLRYGEKIQL
jgi:hypothetical protein